MQFSCWLHFFQSAFWQQHDFQSLRQPELPSFASSNMAHDCGRLVVSPITSVTIGANWGSRWKIFTAKSNHHGNFYTPSTVAAIRGRPLLGSSHYRSPSSPWWFCFGTVVKSIVAGIMKSFATFHLVEIRWQQWISNATPHRTARIHVVVVHCIRRHRFIFLSKWMWEETAWLSTKNFGQESRWL